MDLGRIAAEICNQCVGFIECERDMGFSGHLVGAVAGKVEVQVVADILVACFAVTGQFEAYARGGKVFGLRSIAGRTEQDKQRDCPDVERRAGRKGRISIHRKAEQVVTANLRIFMQISGNAVRYNRL